MSYALPILWRTFVVGWANVTVVDGTLRADFGYIAAHRPRDRRFTRELEAEVERLRRFVRPRRD